MRTRNVIVAAALIFSGGLASVALAVPVHAQAGEPCPPAQPSDRPIDRPSSPPGQPADRPPQYPPGKCELRLSRSVVPAGGTLQAAGAGFAPGTPVEVTMAGASLGSATANGAGAFESTLVVPASTEPGAYTVTASGLSAFGGTQALSASLTVTPGEGGAANRAGGRAATGAGGGAQAEGGSDLPRTGSSSPLPLGLAGVTLLAVGTAAVVAARRRSTQGR